VSSSPAGECKLGIAIAKFSILRNDIGIVSGADRYAIAEFSILRNDISIVSGADRYAIAEFSILRNNISIVGSAEGLRSLNSVCHAIV
jgi:hypothetical protein